MRVKQNSKIKTSTNYTFKRKAGKSIIEKKPVFSPDGESLLLVVENVVRVYSIHTGDCSRTLETESCVKELVSIQFPENENYNLYGCSDEGYITTWTWESGAVLREIKLQIPENAKILTFNLIDSNECLVTTIRPNEKDFQVASYYVKTGELVYNFNNTRPPFYGIIRVSLGWSGGDRYAAIINGAKLLYIQNINNPHLRTVIMNTNRMRIISVAAHHSESAVAITDSLGRVTIFRGNVYNNKQVAKEVLHWHFLPVFDVCFSMQGSYVYTGGMEKVLVKWTIGHLANKANEKIFIPRLPGMIRHIAVSHTHVAITLTNNAVVIATAEMHTVGTILECGGLSPSIRAFGSSLVYHRRLRSLIISGRTGHLQVYSTNTDKVLYNIDITEMNTLPSERYNLLPVETEVTCAAVSADGSWLVTSEYRNDGFTYPEERLKFWSLQAKSTCPFKLNTCVNLSHGGCNVVSIVLNSKAEFCVTAGSDQKFRIWKQDKMLKPRNKVSWSCLTACYYSSGLSQFLSSRTLNDFKQDESYSLGKTEDYPYLKELHKNDIVLRIFNIHRENVLYEDKRDDFKSREFDMGDVAISQDGSLIAAWFGSKLTLWDSHLCNLRTTLSHPALRPKGIHVRFGNHDSAHYLVCTTESCVAVWSLLSLTVKWLVQLTPSCLAASPLSNHMAVVTTNNDVYVFTPNSSKPVLTKKCLIDPKTGTFKQCTFGAQYGDDIRLYLLRNDSEIYCLEPDQSEENNLEVITHRNLPTTNFGALLAEQQLSAVKSGRSTEINQLNIDALGNSAISQFLSGAPHMVPPVSLLCTSFLRHISGEEETEEPADVSEDIMEVDPSSEDEDAPRQKEQHTPKPTEMWQPNYEQVKEKRLTKILGDPLLDQDMTSSLFSV